MNLRTKDGDTVQVNVKTMLAVVALVLSLGGAAFYLVFTTATVSAKLDNESVNRARDMTELKETMRDYQAQVVSGFVTTQAYIAANSAKVEFMTGMLTREQQERVNRYNEAHPMPSLPNPEQFKFRPSQPSQPRGRQPTSDNEQGETNNVRSSL